MIIVEPGQEYFFELIFSRPTSQADVLSALNALGFDQILVAESMSQASFGLLLKKNTRLALNHRAALAIANANARKASAPQKGKPASKPLVKASTARRSSRKPFSKTPSIVKATTRVVQTPLGPVAIQVPAPSASTPAVPAGGGGGGGFSPFVNDGGGGGGGGGGFSPTVDDGGGYNSTPTDDLSQDDSYDPSQDGSYDPSQDGGQDDGGGYDLTQDDGSDLGVSDDDMLFQNAETYDQDIAQGTGQKMFRFVGTARTRLMLQDQPFMAWKTVWPVKTSLLSNVSFTPRPVLVEPGKLYDLRILSSKDPAAVKSALQNLGILMTKGPFLLRRHIRHPALLGELFDYALQGSVAKAKAFTDGGAPGIVIQDARA